MPVTTDLFSAKLCEVLWADDKSKPYKNNRLGTVPGNGVQAHLNCSEKPKVAIMVTHLENPGLLGSFMPTAFYFPID